MKKGKVNIKELLSQKSAINYDELMDALEIIKNTPEAELVAIINEIENSDKLTCLNTSDNKLSQIDMPSEDWCEKGNNALNNIPKELREFIDYHFNEPKTGANNSWLEKLKNIYKYVDEINKYIIPFTPCKKGCSACCNIPVLISPSEADYISYNCSIKLKEHPLSENIDKYGHCPFLINDECSIYEYRPFYCRQYHTFVNENKPCTSEIMNSNDGNRMIMFPALILAMAEFQIRNGKPNVYDIRQFFGA